MKKIPTRTCMGCNEKKPKQEFLRIVKTPEGKIQIDTTGKMAGRGAYICNSLECFEKVIRSKRLEKSLGSKISEEIYKELKDKIEKQGV